MTAFITNMSPVSYSCTRDLYVVPSTQPLPSFLATNNILDLALALSDKNETQEFHVLLILIILIITIFFCHSLIRLCMMIINPPAEGDPGRQRLPSMVGPSGYAETSVPIPVALARDEEAAGIESEATKVPPPAYGLWRESVVCNPRDTF
jgi:hypothetical protein